MPLPKLDQPDQPEPESALVAVTPDAERRARIAQVLLVTRLRARNRRDLAMDSLERAAQVIFVTCKSWFSSPFSKTSNVSAPEPTPTPTPADTVPDHPPLEKNHDDHAHCNH